MKFIFYSKYINTNTDFKQIECDLYDTITYF